ncbi:MBL fold metallo-hydrolase [Micromonospora taraxaci]|uniref:MBL fold metallo-hydrolase n=1 Tax=Micromonospora taraxaci TaxID=1316803 RepID=UPI0033FA5CBD
MEWDGYRLVLDLGYATLPRLLAHWPDGALDAVVITHEHPDHCIDLHGLFRMRLYGDSGGPQLPLYCPPGVLERLSGLEPDVDLHAVFDVHLLPGIYRVGPFELTGLSLPHYVPNTGIRLEADGIAVAYSGTLARPLCWPNSAATPTSSSSRPLTATAKPPAPHVIS